MPPFKAASYDDTTFELELQSEGSGIPSNTHAQALYIENSEGSYSLIAVDDPLWEKARWVKNRLTNRDNLTGWTNYLSSDSWDGTATKVTATDTGGFIYTTFVYGGGALANRSFVLSFDVWTDAGQGTTANMRFYDSGGVNVNGGNMTISTTSQRFAVAGTFPPGETDTSITIRVGAAVSGDYIYVNKAQLEETTLNLDVALPGEYQDTTTPTAYANANGNTISSQLVTLAAGTPFTDQPYLHYQSAATNVLLQNRDFSTTWVANNSVTGVQDEVGITGQTNTAWTLTDNNASGYANYSQQVTISNDGLVNTFIFWVKKDTDTSRFPFIDHRVKNGTDVVNRFYINTSTGAITDDTVNGTHTIKQIGDFWKITSSITNNSTGNTLAVVAIYPAAATVVGTLSAAATGSVIIDVPMLLLNTSETDSHPIAPIITGATSGTTDETNCTWDATNHDNIEGGYYVEVDYQGGEVDILLNDDVAIVYVTSDVLYLDDGTNTISTAITEGEHQIGIAWETDTSEMELCLDEIWYGGA